MITKTGYTTGKSVAAGALGGAVAGAVMIIPMMIANMQIGLPADIFPVLLGRMMGQGPATAVGVGIGIHMLASTIIGVIFGAVTSTDKLRLTSFGKGIGLGIATGIIAFVILFLPMTMTVLPQQMMALMQMMNPNAPSAMVMQKLQAMMPMMIGGSILAHIIYGAVLGVVATAIIRKSAVYQCGQCHMIFRSGKEFHQHAEQYHAKKN